MKTGDRSAPCDGDSAKRPVVSPLKVGIWIELPPYADWSGEGIVRLLSFVVEHSPDGVEYLMYVPHWLHETVKRDVHAWGERSRKIVTVMHRPGFLPLLLQSRINSRRAANRNGIGRRLELAFRNHATKLLTRVAAILRAQFASLNPFTFPAALVGDLIIAIIAMAAALLLLTLALPILVAAAMVGAVLALLRRSKIGQKIEKKRRELAANLMRMAAESLPDAIDLEFKRMAKYANKERVSCWFVTYPGYRNAEFLKAPICLLFPDFVVGEFPNLYQKPAIEYHKKLFSVLIPKAKQFITISDHVKNKYLIGVFAAEPDRCRTIRHASPSLASYAPFLPVGMRKSSTSKRAAADTIRDYCTSHFDEWSAKGPITTGVVQPYLLGFPFEHVPYVLVATQNRPYKNTLGVIRAVQKLNQHGTPCKLIMTGDFGLDDPVSDIGRYVRRERLLLDVLCIPRVPREILAALFHCATVAVHASFYEGGVGAFPFFEGMSVGTPALLSRNQATLELDAGEDIDEFLFEPSNVDEIAEKIKAILKAPEGAFKRQRPIYSSLNRRTWQEASREYIAAFRETAHQERRAFRPTLRRRKRAV